ncbi:4-coumarate--CoA ligase 3 [Aphelenchoides fujianensis]|nr:4-coumarate--CoA ligase 3 [Aphelenchoides fujianensis]
MPLKSEYPPIPLPDRPYHEDWENKTAEKQELPFGVLSFDEAIATPPDFHQEKPHFDITRDLILLPYSSGTTGSPKGVMLTHSNYSTMMRASTAHFSSEFHKRMTPPFDPPKEHALIFLPGTTVVLLPRFDADLFCRCVQEYKIRFLYLVPPILVFLAKSPLVEKYDLSSLEVLLSAAAPAGKDVIDAVKKRHPNVKVVSQGYGMTEMSLASHLHHFEGPPGNVGKLMGNMEMKIVDVSTGEELPAGQRGEICVKGRHEQIPRSHSSSVLQALQYSAATSTDPRRRPRPFKQTAFFTPGTSACWTRAAIFLHC